MHPDELAIYPALAAALIHEQFPQFAHLPVTPVRGSGTVNTIFRVGDALTARFPLQAEEPVTASRMLQAEALAAAEFAEVAKIPSPRPEGIGSPDLGYPMPWTLQTWVPGQPTSPRAEEHNEALVADIAALLRRLRDADTRGRTFHGRGRGGSLRAHDEWVEHCIDESTQLLDTQRAREIWAWFRELPTATSWVMSHTDLTPANLLVEEGRLAGVLDSGGFAPADPALDLVVAWHLFDSDRRRALQESLGSDATEWARGAAWAFQQAMGLVWYYQTSNQSMSELGLSALDRIFEAASRDDFMSGTTQWS